MAILVITRWYTIFLHLSYVYHIHILHKPVILYLIICSSFKILHLLLGHPSPLISGYRQEGRSLLKKSPRFSVGNWGKAEKTCDPMGEELVTWMFFLMYQTLPSPLECICPRVILRRAQFCLQIQRSQKILPRST